MARVWLIALLALGLCEATSPPLFNFTISQAQCKHKPKVYASDGSPFTLSSVGVCPIRNGFNNAAPGVSLLYRSGQTFPFQSDVVMADTSISFLNYPDPDRNATTIEFVFAVPPLSPYTPTITGFLAALQISAVDFGFHFLGRQCFGTYQLQRPKVTIDGIDITYFSGVYYAAMVTNSTCTTCSFGMKNFTGLFSATVCGSNSFAPNDVVSFSEKTTSNTDYNSPATEFVSVNIWEEAINVTKRFEGDFYFPVSTTADTYAVTLQGTVSKLTMNVNAPAPLTVTNATRGRMFPNGTDLYFDPQDLYASSVSLARDCSFLSSASQFYSTGQYEANRIYSIVSVCVLDTPDPPVGYNVTTATVRQGSSAFISLPVPMDNDYLNSSFAIHNGTAYSNLSFVEFLAVNNSLGYLTKRKGQVCGELLSTCQTYPPPFDFCFVSRKQGLFGTDSFAHVFHDSGSDGVISSYIFSTTTNPTTGCLASECTVSVAEGSQVNVTLRVKSVFLPTLSISALPTHGKLYDGEVLVTFAGQTVGENVTYVPDANYFNRQKGGFKTIFGELFTGCDNGVVGCPDSFSYVAQAESLSSPSTITVYVDSRPSPVTATFPASLSVTSSNKNDISGLFSITDLDQDEFPVGISFTVSSGLLFSQAADTFSTSKFLALTSVCDTSFFDSTKGCSLVSFYAPPKIISAILLSLFLKMPAQTVALIEEKIRFEVFKPDVITDDFVKGVPDISTQATVTVTFSQPVTADTSYSVIYAGLAAYAFVGILIVAILYWLLSHFWARKVKKETEKQHAISALETLENSVWYTPV